MQNIKFVFILPVIFCSFILYSYAQITPYQAISQMLKGINLGNTHEPPLEAGWNNPKAEEYYFDMYKAEGFQCVRIPVRWDGYTSKTNPYKIDTNWLNRIEQVVDWGLKRDLFIVLNAHHEEWIKSNYTENNKARFDSIWSQISLRFQNKSEKLIFEIINEPFGLTKAQNDDLHQRVLSIIRKSNPKRLVILQGHNWGGSEELITMAIPKDTFIIGSFHSYDPYLFGLEGQGTWGAGTDYTALDVKFKSVSNWSVQNKIPVFLGEFGATSKCDYNSRMKHYRAYVEFAQKYGFAAMAWDDGGDFRIMERQQHNWNEIKDILISTNAKSPFPLIDVYQDSVIRIRWSNRVTDNDSIIIQRKLGTDINYSNIAFLSPGTEVFYDEKPESNKYYNYRLISYYKNNPDLYSQPVRTFFPAWIKKTRTPYWGTPFNIPGIIEAEDFDIGGEGLTYHDADAINLSGAYRPTESVEVYDRLGMGYHIGNIVPGEWYEYSVNVKSNGWYNLSTSIAAPTGGGTFQISIDSLKVPVQTVAATYSALTTKDIITKIYLTAGNKIMRFSVLSGPSYNIDKFTFELATLADKLSDNLLPPFIAWQNRYKELVIRKNNNDHVRFYKIVNIAGQILKVIHNPDNQVTISGSEFPGGIYLIQGYQKNFVFTQKIIIR